MQGIINENQKLPSEISQINKYTHTHTHINATNMNAQANTKNTHT